MHSAPLKIEKLLAASQQEDEKLLHWLQQSASGRKYLGRLLLQVEGVTPESAQAFQKAGGFKLKLDQQFALLDSLLARLVKRIKGRPAMKINRRLSTGAMLTQIKRTAAGDKRAPIRLRRWLGHKQSCEELARGWKLAAQYWPDESEIFFRERFSEIVTALALNPNVLKIMLNRDQPRRLARALVNFAVGNPREFARATLVVQQVVQEVMSAKTISRSLKDLAQLKVSESERRDKPAARLKQALETQLRRLEAPSNRKIVKQAVRSAPPYWLDSLKIGQRKDAIRRLSLASGKAQSHLRYSRGG